jgi:hypothetical protein
MFISNINYNSNGGSQNNNLNFQNINMAQTQYIPNRCTKKLYVKLTQDEQNMFSKIYKYLDPQNKGRIDGKPAADFMKRSNLDKFTLKNIWLIAAQTNNKFLEREELFVALRLIALAQNNMTVSELSIEKNYPIPPLPKLKNNSINNNNINNNINNDNKNQNNLYEISEKEKMIYKNIFDNNKENNTEKIKAHNAILIWKENNASDESIKIVARIINPLETKGFFNLREFQVASHMISISNKFALPQKLPDNLLNYLGRNFNNNINNNFNNGNNDNDFNTNNSISRLTTIQKTNTNFLDESQFSVLNRQLSNTSYDNNNKINELLRKEEKLLNESNLLNNELNIAKNKIRELFKEIRNIKKDLDLINNELMNIKKNNNNSNININMNVITNNNNSYF